MQNYYKMLGVTKDASAREIKSAYHKKAKEYHPDKVIPEKKQQMAEEFGLISKAYNILKDKDKRKEYDKAFTEAKNKMRAGKTPSVSSDETTSISKKIDRSQANEVAEKAFKIGVSLFNDKQYSKAIEYFESAVKANKKNPESQMFLALSYAYAHKSVNKAVEHCQAAIDLDPWNIIYKVHLGKIYKMAGIITLAKKQFKEVLKWEPDNLEAKVALQELGGKKIGGGSGFFSKLFKKKK